MPTEFDPSSKALDRDDVSHVSFNAQDLSSSMWREMKDNPTSVTNPERTKLNLADTAQTQPQDNLSIRSGVQEAQPATTLPAIELYDSAAKPAAKPNAPAMNWDTHNDVLVGKQLPY